MRAAVYCGNNFQDYIGGDNITELKRKASRICNKRNQSIDKMEVLEPLRVTFIRINKLSPNNTVIRGSWK